MKCSFCNEKAIYFDGKKFYCKKHFIEYFENKVLDTIEKFELISSEEKVGVAVSGGKDSIGLLHLLTKYKEYFNIKVYGIHIDEGIGGYREILTSYLVNLAKKNNWDLRIFTFKDYFGVTLDEAVRLLKDLKPCTICGVWRRWLMWKASIELKLDKLATAHNINDEVQTLFMNLFEGNIKDIAKSGPKVGLIDYGFVPRIKPYYFVTEKESMLYAIINGIAPPWTECPYIRGQMRDKIRRNLYKLEEKYAGFHRKILENFTNLLPKIKEKYKNKFKINLKPCKLCGYPTSREICRACEIKLKIYSLKKSGSTSAR